MIKTGSQLKIKRQEIGLSQSRMAELTGIKQSLLSAFELEKKKLPDLDIQQINSILSNTSNHSEIINRKKRYEKHIYNNDHIDEKRAYRHQITDINAEYIENLKQLSAEVKPSFKAVSCFAGIGGLSLGFKSAGFEISGFVELNDDLAKIYQANFPQTEKLGSDITQITDEALNAFKKKIGDIDVVVGGPPCQGFSLSGKRNIQDPRNYLFQDYLRVIDLLSPKFAIIENVKLLTSMKSLAGGFVKDEILLGLKKHGYRAQLYIINAKNYGVPQHRERVFFVAVREDLNVNPSFPLAQFGVNQNLFNNSKSVRTFADACSDLPFLEAGQHCEDQYHQAVKHPAHVLKWLWDVPEGSSAHDNKDASLRPPSGYNTTYKRQVWNEPAATVQTTFGMISGCRNVHPIATRSLTIREASRLQSFPDSYKFTGSLGTIRTGIGNAVPPLLARAIATHISTILTDLIKIPSL